MASDVGTAVVQRAPWRPALAASVALHALLGAFVVGSVHRPLPVKPGSNSVWVEVSARGEVASARGGVRAKHGRRASPSSAAPLARFGISMVPDPSESVHRGEGAPESEFKEGRTRQALGVDLAAEARTHTFARAVFRRVDPLLVYPDELTARGIEGTVTAIIRFNAQGEYLESASDWTSSSPYLKVLVARTLRQALAEPLNPAARRAMPPHRTLTASFQFTRLEHASGDERGARQAVLGDSVRFFRSYARSVAEWDLGPLHGVGPFPALDLLWLPRVIGDALSTKVKADPLERYREDPLW